jgi:uncharacterized damage-inducible protein DinB
MHLLASHHNDLPPSRHVQRKDVPMDILDRLLGHDAWTTRQLLIRAQGLSDEQLDRRFPIGHGSLRDTFVHLIRNMEVWTDLIAERPIRSRPASERATIGSLIERLDAVAADFAVTAKGLEDKGRLDDTFADGPSDLDPLMKTFGGAIAHLVTHSMHHRAQLLNMMRHLGMQNLIEGDLLSWEAAHRPGGWKRRSDR